MKLLFLNTNIGYGGASKMIVWVASQCAKNGYDVTFLTYRDKVICQSIDPMVKLVHEQLEDVGGRSNFLLSVKCIHNFIKKNSFDIDCMPFCFAGEWRRFRVLHASGRGLSA